MAEEAVPVSSALTPAPAAAAPAPVAAAPAPAASPAPAPVKTDAAAPESSAPVVESAPAAEAPPAEGAEPAEAAAPAETPPADADAPKPEGTPAAEPVVAAPKYEAFKLPETIKATPEQMIAYTGLLAKHNLSQEAGQELIDFHANAVKQMGEQMAQQQQDVFAETRRGWQQEFFKEAGNRRDTLLNDAKFAVGEIFKDKKDREAFWNVLNFTGVGDHPANIKAWAKVGKILRENKAPPPSIPNNRSSERPEDRRYRPKAS